MASNPIPKRSRFSARPAQQMTSSSSFSGGGSRSNESSQIALNLGGKGKGTAASLGKIASKTKGYFDEEDSEEEAVAVGPIVKDAGKMDEDYDPLDEFMAGVTQQASKELQEAEAKTADFQSGLMADFPEQGPEIVSGDYVQDYCQSDSEEEGKSGNMTEKRDNTDLSRVENSDLEIYLASSTSKRPPSVTDPQLKAKIEPLPPVDHSSINYPKFTKSFYKECEEVRNLDEQSVAEYRKQQIMSVVSISGAPSASSSLAPVSYLPKPVSNFAQTGLNSVLLAEIQRAGYETPTPIQAQTLPIALSGMDMIGLAKTGSGKTLAYVFPIISHVLAQPQMQIGDGPIAIILAPTRELVTQIYVECKKFAHKLFKMRVLAIVGGAGKYEMTKALKETAPEIVVATPGRLIEMVRNKATNLHRCTAIVLDEADRMFEMGFEYQMRSIVCNTRPDRQTLLFSATMKRKIENFAHEILHNAYVPIPKEGENGQIVYKECMVKPVRVLIGGSIGQANPDIRQEIHVFSAGTDAQISLEKWNWLAERIDEFAADGKVLIFVLSKLDCEELASKLKKLFLSRQFEVGVDCIHGDREQSERSHIMARFKGKSSFISANSSGNKGGEITILVATDIASRGLDVKDVRTVVNFDVAKNIETYVHRIGRTGRMGVHGVLPGTAHTLISASDSSFAVDLVQNLNLSNQAHAVSPELLKIAKSDPKWSRISHFSSRSTSIGVGVGGPNTAGFVSEKWGNGGGKGGKGGLGMGNRALTSEMLAARTHGGAPLSSIVQGFGTYQPLSSIVGSNLEKQWETADAKQSKSYTNNNIGMVAKIQTSDASFRANPYIENQNLGRGKHLTQPAWASAAPPTQIISGGMDASTDAETDKKSRFSYGPIPSLQQHSGSTTKDKFCLPTVFVADITTAEGGRVSAESVRKSRFSDAPPVAAPATQQKRQQGSEPPEIPTVSPFPPPKPDQTGSSAHEKPRKRSRWDA